LINATPSVSNLPETGDDLNFAYIALSVLIVGLITVITRKRLHDSRPQ
jgi:LPXTG-motif cell wall-anchored protein